MPSVATRMKLEIIILNEVSKTKEIAYDIAYLRTLKKNDTIKQKHSQT